MRKLSPLTVPYRMLRRSTSLLALVVFSTFMGGPSVPSGAMGDLGGGALVAASLALAGGALLLAYETAYYNRFSYDLDGDTLDIRSGVLARRNREIPLGRIQNVDIRRNAVERLAGLAVVSFETAGGGETEATLRYVAFEEAKRLQGEVARLKRGTEVEEAAPEAATLFAITGRELATLGLLSFDLRVPGVVFLVLSGSVPVVSSFVPSLNPVGRPPGEALALGAALLAGVLAFSWLAGATVAVLNYHGFRLARVGEELQYERGLLRRFDGSIPVEKVQTLTVEDSPLKRALGYATLRIETAGYAAPGGDGDGGGATTAVPLADRDRVMTLAREIEPFGEPAFERPPTRARRRYLVRYLLALAVPTALAAAIVRVVPLPPGFAAALAAVPRAVWLAPLLGVPVAAAAAHLKWRHRGWWLGPDHVVTRNGVWTRRIKVVPYYRIQTVLDTRTPFQRRRRLATVTADTAGSLSILGSDAAAVDVDGGVADDLRAELEARLVASLTARRAERRARRLRELAADAEPSDSVVGDGPDSTGADADGAGDGPGTDDAGPEDPDGGFRFGGALDGSSDEASDADADPGDADANDAGADDVDANDADDTDDDGGTPANAGADDANDAGADPGGRRDRGGEGPSR